jgi:hypothetical protein
MNNKPLDRAEYFENELKRAEAKITALRVGIWSLTLVLVFLCFVIADLRGCIYRPAP